MRTKIGTICMILGTVLMLSALSLFLYNQHEAAQAQLQATELLPQLMAAIQESSETAIPGGMAPTPLEPTTSGMKEINIDGYDYIGCLSIPKLELELPVMASWDYKRLKIAPCRYTGTINKGNLVLMAHNYSYHFGGLSKLSNGDMVYFTDVTGKLTRYQVVAQDILVPTAVEEMAASGFDLTLFTCTYGGKSRVTVYCNCV